MVSKLAGEGAMPPPLPALASRRLEIAHHLIRRGSLLCRLECSDGKEDRQNLIDDGERQNGARSPDRFSFQIDGNNILRRAVTIPIRQNGVDACTTLSNSSVGTASPKTTTQNGTSIWFGSLRETNMVSATRILELSYKDLHRATYNFSTLIGQGVYGPVYKAQMPTGEAVAVKVLGTYSKQGEKEFHTKVLLLGRLHHRNLVNLVGYCAEKGQYMLIYVYMSSGSLDPHLYDEVLESLSWNLRVQIALDVARGLDNSIFSCTTKSESRICLLLVNPLFTVFKLSS
nr:calcium/calmodulin-regulated receptor-like kinase 1 [Ipomoea batatas]